MRWSKRVHLRRNRSCCIAVAFGGCWSANLIQGKESVKKREEERPEKKKKNDHPGALVGHAINNILN